MEQEFCMTRLDWVEESTKSVWNIFRTLKISVLEENNVVMNENSVEGKPCINREIKRLYITI